MDKQARKELKRRASVQLEADAEAEWHEHMTLEPEQLKALFDRLDEQLPDAGCDHSLRVTIRWAADQGIDGERLAESLLHFGGGCDCEVLANVDPESRVRAESWPSYLARFGSS